MRERSPFARGASRLIEQGYSPIPIMLGKKIPGASTFLKGWNDFCNVVAPPDKIA